MIAIEIVLVTLAINAALPMIAYIPSLIIIVGNKSFKMIAKSRPKAAPKTQYGTPAGIVHVKARIVKVKLSKQKTIKLKPTAGYIQTSFSCIGSLEKRLFIVFLSPCLMKSIG